MSNSSSFAEGQIVGGNRYRLIRFLGKGGMGEVWLAADSLLQEDVALKFLPPNVRNDPEALEDMRRETRKSRKLSHPNIIRIHDLFEAEGESPFISMEFVDGPSLAKHKAAQPQRCFKWEDLKSWAVQLCQALQYAHTQGLVHRDLKPGNIMLDANGTLKLADFGIAAHLSDQPSGKSEAPAVSGTPAYMSPQQFDGKPPRPSDDIYSLGATLYELLTSKPPFHSGDIAHQTRSSPPPALEERLAELQIENSVPPEVSLAILECVAKLPEQRPASVADFAERAGVELTVDSAKAKRTVRNALLISALVIIACITGVSIYSNRSLDAEASFQRDIENGWLPLYGPGAIAASGHTDRWRRNSNLLIGISDKPSILLSGDSYTNFQFRVDVHFKAGTAAAIVLRSSSDARRAGYAIKVSSSGKEPRPAGISIVSAAVISEHARPGVWSQIHAIAIGNRIIVRVNNVTVVEYTDPANTFRAGNIGIAHGPESSVMYQYSRAQALSADEAEAWKEVRNQTSGL